MAHELQDEAVRLAERCRDLARDFERVRKAVQQLGDHAGWAERGTREKGLEVLQSAAGIELPDFADFEKRLRTEIGTWLGRFRQAFLDKLFKSCKERGLSVTALAEQPPTFSLAGLGLVLDFDKGVAEISYGRERIDRMPLKTSELLERCQALHAQLEATWPGAEPFFTQLLGAYRARVGREGKAFGDRVELVDVLPELSLSFAPDAARKASPTAGGKAPTLTLLTRAEFAWLLDRLAREGALAQQGLRLELGTATGGSTKDKKRVLFLEAGMGGGQYYLSLRFVEAVS
ncbi:MAG: hypothetical protein CSA62_01455 [Planctomycetota bacterium]|nr:MAG: hypothetical protein CSA62_01455 [Planctomycetota bacterium]